MSTGLRFAEQALAASAENVPAHISALRKAGAEAFKTLGFPDRHNEDWHYTNVADIASTQYSVAVDSERGHSVDAALLRPYLFDSSWPLVVFVNGRLDAELSTLEALPEGVRVMSLAEAAKSEPELLAKHLGVAAPATRDGFTALNSAFSGEGTLIHIAREMVTDIPVHILHVMDEGAANLMSNPRHLLVAEQQARGLVVESYISLAQVPYFTNSVVEAYLEDGATIQLIRVQRESEKAHHVSTVEARQERDSHFIAFTFQTGGSLSRSNVWTKLDGAGCGCTLNGLFMLDGEQHGDHQTRVEHIAPNCFSREVYKSLLDGRSHGVFNGKVWVWPEAQQTDGKQTNNTLLLSDHAQIDTKPQLEIYADDVKCTHGATVGRIDDTALFYLKSRGVSAEHARRLLMYAFAADVLEMIEVPAVVEELEKLTLHRFTGAVQTA